MLFGKVKSSALVGVAVLLAAASAQDGPKENGKQHLTTFKSVPNSEIVDAGQAGLAAPLNLANSHASKEAVKKLTGTDISRAISNATQEQAHCFVGHPTAKIVRIRYEMSMVVDTGESGGATLVSSGKVKKAVIKATSGLYSQESPEKGSCAKTLARHGETCVNRPYIIPATLLKPSGDQRTDEARDKPVSWYSAGPYIMKRADVGASPRVVFKANNLRESVRPEMSSVQSSDPLTLRSVDSLDAVCVDTVKRNATTTKVVPTKARKVGDRTGAQLHFELVRTEAEKGTWSQIIYDKHGKVMDVTNMTLTEDMSFWRAEYYCSDCAPGHKLHTITYLNVEIEVEESEVAASPTLQCSGRATATHVHKKSHSRYRNKNKSGIEYTGAIFSIDRVSFGHFDKNDKNQSSSKDGAVPNSSDEDKDGQAVSSPKDPYLVNTANPDEHTGKKDPLLVNTANPDEHKSKKDPLLADLAPSGKEQGEQNMPWPKDALLTNNANPDLGVGK